MNTTTLDPADFRKFAEQSIQMGRQILDALAIKQVGVQAQDDMWLASQIVSATARFYGYSLKEFKSDARPQHLAFSRQVAMFFCRELTGISTVAIGQLLGGKNHGTVLYGVQVVKDRIETEPKTAADIRRLREQLKTILGE